MGKNDFNKNMQEFTHMLYGVVYALDYLDKYEDKIKKEDLEKCIKDSLKVKVNRSYRSAIKTDRKFSPNGFSLNEENVHNIVLQANKGIINLLIIGLCDLLDECLLGTHDVDNSKNLYEKIEGMHVDKKYEWSVKGVHELRIIRNCIVHNNGLFSKTAIRELKQYVDKDSNVLENENINPCFEDIFRFRRAVRTFINETKK